MTEQKVTLFRPYPMKVGQKLLVDGGPRGGEWEVIGVSERKIRLRCPVSNRGVEWDRFCHCAEAIVGREWPRQG